jgi:hypothetical protein
MSETDDKDQIKNRFISSQLFNRTADGRVYEITVGKRFKPRIIESFNLVTQKVYRLLPAMIHNQNSKKNQTKIDQRTHSEEKRKIHEGDKDATAQPDTTPENDFYC